jgi:putative exporter of polyketide antibiotics
LPHYLATFMLHCLVVLPHFLLLLNCHCSSCTFWPRPAHLLFHCLVASRLVALLPCYLATSLPCWLVLPSPLLFSKKELGKMNFRTTTKKD